MNTTANVILPETKVANQIPLQPIDRRLPVIWLLHGLFDDESAFLRYTSLERYVNETGLAVVLPRAERSFYTDMVAGGRYWHFITEELPRRMRFFYPLTLDPQQNFVAGASMGGYGAFKWALTYPERFRAVASLSGVMDVTQFGRDHPELLPDWPLIFGRQDPTQTPADLTYLTQHLSANQLYVFQAVGTEDFLYNMNQAIRPLLQQKFKQRYRYIEGPGNHDFQFWDQQLPVLMHCFQKLLTKDGNH